LQRRAAQIAIADGGGNAAQIETADLNGQMSV
jgi:hypothetical protein